MAFLYTPPAHLLPCRNKALDKIFEPYPMLGGASGGNKASRSPTPVAWKARAGTPLGGSHHERQSSEDGREAREGRVAD